MRRVALRLPRSRRRGTSTIHETASGFPLADINLSASTAPASAPTVLVYGHVERPADGDLTLWKSYPFEPEIRDGYLYGRGAVDDKGNLYLLLRAILELAQSGELPVNIRVLCDGEEESAATPLLTSSRAPTWPRTPASCSTA